MLNHIAVMLRGHIRTWRWIYPYVFEFYDKLAYNVDYYMITHQGSQHNTNVYGSFEGRNLIACAFMKPTSDFANSYQNAAYLAYLLLPYKHQREKTVKYDMIFDSRPDVIPVLKPNTHIHKAEPGILYTTQFDLHHNYKYGYYDLAIEDWFLASSSEVYDKMAERFIADNEQSNQITIRTWAENQGFTVNKLNYVRAFMARPNITEAIIDGKLDIDKISYLAHVWTNLSSEEKIDMLNKKLISIDDYNTGSGTCSI